MGNKNQQFIPKATKPFVNLPKKAATICLSVICKNESKTALRMLESAAPLLDHYIVVDTGSTDGTQEIVRNFFAEKKIPGQVYEHE